MRKDLAGAMERKFRPLSLPDGVTLDAIMEWWNNLNFGGTPNPEAMIEDPEFFTAYFAEPDAMVTALRQLAQDGRLKTKKREQEEQGLPVFVVGEEFDEQAALEKKKFLENLQLERQQASAKKTEALEKAVQWDVFGGGVEAEAATSDSDTTVVSVPHIKIGYDVEVEKARPAEEEDDELDSNTPRDGFQEPDMKTESGPESLLQESPAETEEVDEVAESWESETETVHESGEVEESGTADASLSEDPAVDAEAEAKVEIEEVAENWESESETVQETGKVEESGTVDASSSEDSAVEAEAEAKVENEEVPPKDSSSST